MNATESGGVDTASRSFAAAPRFRSLPRDYAVYLFDRDIISATVYSNSMGAGSRAYPLLPLTVVTTVGRQLANSRVIIYDHSF